MRLSDDFLSELKEANDIYDVVSSYVTLKKSGMDYVCNCPFHSEKTPSCHIYTNTQSFYCFGCGAAGDVINFVRLSENLDYMESVRFLAQRAGIAMPEDGGDEGAKIRTRMLEMNREAGKFFHKMLFSPEGKEGLDYLYSRGLTEHTIRIYGLGYAPNSWDKLRSYMNAKGYSDRELENASLCQAGKNNSYYDFFRYRVMFPFFDLRGNIVGFSGRIIGGDDPRKYLNTKETLVYKKSNFLYSMNHAKNSKMQELILCEGNLDVISLFQAGFRNSVATCGTAITDNHARIIANQGFKEVILSYDNDDAGKKATVRAMAILSNVGINTKILSITGAKDPDEYIKKFGADAFINLIQKAMPGMDYELDSLILMSDLNTAQGKSEFLKKSVSFISSVPNQIDRAVYISIVSGKCDISPSIVEDAVKREISRKGRQKRNEEQRELMSGNYNKDKVNKEASKYPLEVRAERGIIAFLIHSQDYLKKITDRINSDYFATEFNRILFSIIVSEISDGREVTISSLGNYFTPAEISSIEKMIIDNNAFPYSMDRLNDYIGILSDYKEKQSTKNISEMSEEELRLYAEKLKNKKT